MTFAFIPDIKLGSYKAFVFRNTLKGQETSTDLPWVWLACVRQLREKLANSMHL